MEIQNIKNIAMDTIRNEAEAISELEKYIDDNFAKLVQEIYHCKGRLIVTGIGKSANIAQKIVATLNSTGTPSIFMHAADAIHGDLGIILKDDIVLCISKSGNTPEITVLIPLIKMSGNRLIGLTGNMDSFLAKQADYVINSSVPKEACPNNLAPTSSTTAQLVMGDALAVCLLEMRGFTSSDFAKFHPGGSLGKKLYLRCSDLIINNEKPSVVPNDDIKTVIIEISQSRLGLTAVVENDKIEGIITDGDLRRMMQKNENFEGIKASEIMSLNPKTIQSTELAIRALEIMRTNSITGILVCEGDKYVGVIHLHDILKEGLI
ncbi:MAG: KpsF/GutQ family sugar-phosphate isomerase [Bacteroidales bacterium]|jgi:arabinose-5-phosphate isomerase|nr:KpsF/GutQ family sugar-phosphate isomerase [Bacteroidales bacterium]